MTTPLSAVRLLLTALLIIPTAVLAAPGDVYYVDGSFGDDSAAGTAASPWRTIQHAAGFLTAGETVIVRAGTYQSLETSFPNSEVKAFKPQNSGTANAPITYAAAAGESVVIDQNGQGAGFYIHGVDHLIIRGFEIRNALRGGIWTAKDGQSGIVIEDNHIYMVDGDSGQNVGAVKLDGCTDCIVRNNVFHDVMVGGERHVNGAGVHSYDMAGTTISGNELYDTYTGVFHKRSSGGDPVVIDGNTIHKVTIGVLFSVGGAGDPAHINPVVSNNVLYDYETAVSATTFETSLPSRGLTITGNRFSGGDAILLWGMKNVRISDNEFAGTQVAIRTVQNTERPVSFDQSDYNYFPGDALFVLNEWGSDRAEFASLAHWQSGTGLDSNSSTAQHPENPSDPGDTDDPPEDDGVGGYFAELFAAYASRLLSTFDCLFSEPDPLPLLF